jgi:uncharacterized protein YlaN (UPF0358 family)
MIPDNKDKKKLSEVLRGVVQTFAQPLDMVNTRSFPDKHSSIPVKEQITAAAHTQAFMESIHIKNQMNQLVIPQIPEEALALAQAAYMEGLRKRGGDAAVELELQRRENYAELVRRNDEVLSNELKPPELAPFKPEMVAQSVVIYVDFDGDKGPEPTF